MFLAVDTVFDQCSVAIVNAEFEVLECQTQSGKREQTQQILPMIDSGLRQTGLSLSDISALIFNRGPGAFSGIRINTAVVQALSVAQDIPCVGVSSLAAIAQSAYDTYGVEHVYAALDARMKQVYFGEYRRQALPNLLPKEEKVHDAPLRIMQQVAETTEGLMDYNQITTQSIAIAGNGAPLLAAQSGQLLYSDICPDAACLAKLGIVAYQQTGGVPPHQALPVYLRNNAWKTLKEQGKSS